MGSNNYNQEEILINGKTEKEIKALPENTEEEIRYKNFLLRELYEEKYANAEVDW